MASNPLLSMFYTLAQAESEILPCQVGENSKFFLEDGNHRVNHHMLQDRPGPGTLRTALTFRRFVSMELLIQTLTPQITGGTKKRAYSSRHTIW